MCGVVGFYGIEEPVPALIDLMVALQHRGEQSSGVSLALRNGGFFYERRLGLVSDLAASFKFQQIG